MKLPISWLQDYVRVPVEPARLAQDLAFVGFEVASVEAHGADTVLDVEVTTNRVDCMNVYGLAREIAVMYEQPLLPLDLTFAETGTPAAQALDVAIESPELCPRFCARVLDVRIAPSPAWLQARLESAGVRPINNVVDVTNYVMLEMGQPTHAFDLARVPGARLVARFAREGERLTTLDGTERTLTARTGVVAGGDGALALAGVMGGASSEVSDATRAIALEAAYWEPLVVRRAAKALSMHTEASHRFERGADPEAPPASLARIAHLLQKIGAGSARPGVVDRVGRPINRRRAVLRPAHVDRVLGLAVPAATSRRILTGLGFELDGGSSEIAVVVPSWRGDVAREVDLIEEIARHHGLDKIRPTLPPAKRVEGLRPWQVRERAIRECLVGAGVSEVISYAFVRERPTVTLPGAGVALLNPLSEDQAVLRRSLVMPGLMNVLQTNLRQGRRDVRVFELGRAFFDDRPLPREERRLALLLHGSMTEPYIGEKPRPADFFDAKGLVQTIADRLDATAAFEREGTPAFLHPGRSAMVTLGGAVAGWIGEVHPDIAAEWELREPAIVAELSIDGLLSATPGARRFASLPRFPLVARDLSFVCDETAAAESLQRTIRAAAGPLLQSVEVVDRYTGGSIPREKVSLTLTLRYQHPARTLTGEEVQQSVDAVVRALAAMDISVRGE